MNYILEQDAAFFTTKPGLLFNRANIGGIDYKGGQHYRSKNPPVGVTFELFIKDEGGKVKDNRPEVNNDLPHYPNTEQLQAEDWEESGYLLFEVANSAGDKVARFTRKDRSGIERFTWNGKYSSTAETSTNAEPKTNPSTTTFVLPGTYEISVFRSTNGVLTELIAGHAFEVNHLYDYESIDMEFNQEVDRVYATSNEVMSRFNKLSDELTELRAGLRNTPGTSMEDLNAARTIALSLKQLGLLINGNRSLTKREVETASSLGDVMGLLAWGAWNHRGAPTGTMKNLLEDAKMMISDAQTQLDNINESVHALEAKAKAQGVPYWD